MFSADAFSFPFTPKSSAPLSCGEIVDSYGEVLVSALKSDPTVCLVEFSFTVAHGLNRIYLTAHITV